MDMNKHEILEHKMCKELETLAEKYSSGQELAIQDLDKIDKLYHALKSLATYTAMKEAEEYSEDGFSGRRGRSPSTGRYVSRDMNSMDHSYAQGYSEGYMDGQQSGHFPSMPPYRRY